MTAYYVDSNAAGANNGTSWTDAYSDVTTAIASKSAGDIFYTASNHAESTASAITISAPNGSHLNPVIFISAATAASPPTTFTRGASVTSTNTGTFSIGLSTRDSSAVFIGFDFTSSGSKFFLANADDVNYFL